MILSAFLRPDVSAADISFAIPRSAVRLSQARWERATRSEVFNG
jgi:hypothetical protein